MTGNACRIPQLGIIKVSELLRIRARASADGGYARAVDTFVPGSKADTPVTGGSKQIGEVVPSVALVGTRGYPSYYSGFETAVRKLAPYLVSAGWDVTVYGRPGATRPEDPDRNACVVTRETRGLETKSTSTLSYGFTSVLDAAARRPDVALVMNVANGYYLPLLRARGVPTLVNVDGLEWERAKWNTLAKAVFRTGAKSTAKWANSLVFDARAIEAYWRERFGVEGLFIPYGGDVPPALEVPDG